MNPSRVHEILAEGQDWQFLDVRTVEEFQLGHVPGAFNVPVFLREAHGMVPNPRFVELVQKTFSADAKLVLGCAAGMRSARACDMLDRAGYSQLVNMAGGFSGATDPAGAVVEPGWQSCGLPVEAQSQDGRDYASLVK